MTNTSKALGERAPHDLEVERPDLGDGYSTFYAEGSRIPAQHRDNGHRKVQAAKPAPNVVVEQDDPPVVGGIVA
ncbi:hypothetical protein [Nocardioides ungokensis]|uniref:hypothetical protein n=1 Tax=Nocardioides ungokensis TaxID=1643322 RepID=UPI0015DE2DF4|nr:hypothetical protein [Nocardioides ungokensis]